MVYPTRDKAVKDVTAWIELTCNHTRLHSALSYHTPNDAEKRLLTHHHTTTTQPTD